MNEHSKPLSETEEPECAVGDGVGVKNSRQSSSLIQMV